MRKYLLLAMLFGLFQTSIVQAQERMDEIEVFGQRLAGASEGQMWAALNRLSDVYAISMESSPAGDPIELVALDTKKLCGANAQTTSRSDADDRARAANEIFQKAFQGPARIRANGNTFTITFSDGGTEKYMFAAFSSIGAVPVAGTLVQGSGVAAPDAGKGQGCTAVG